MKITKITKALPLAVLALAFSTSFAMADDQSPSASTNFHLTLPEYLKITAATETLAKTVTYDDDYTGANLEAMTATYTVITNDPGKSIYLQATCATSGTPANALFSPAKDPSKLFLALSNESVPPAAEAVGKACSETKADTPNVITLSLTPTLTHDLDNATGITPEWDEAGQVHYVVKNGTGTFSYLTGTKVEANSFSTHDTHGIYKATLTMTKTTL